jgi:excisionase family DNA binding protein
MVMSVREAADLLGLDQSRVRQLVHQGDLGAVKVSGVLLIDEGDVARLADARGVRGRPLSPDRAWAALLFLEGAPAPWLDPVGRSKVRRLLSGLAGAPAARWRAALRARSEVIRCRAHPSALERLGDKPGVLVAGPQAASASGVDLVVVAEDIRELYVARELWARYVNELAIRERAQEPNLVARVPNRLWPFEGLAKPGLAVLAADLLGSPDPRAVDAGAAALNRLATGMAG